MRISKRIIVFCFISLLLCPAKAQIGMQELGDSLTAYTGFSRVWSPPVRVKQLRVSGKRITLRTNKTLRDVRWTPENVADIKGRISMWVLGNTKGEVTILSGNTNIENLITDCARQTAKRSNSPKNGQTNRADLTNRQIVIYPSHGLYFNHNRNEWIWQRATLWTTVEDLYSQEYVRLIKRMLENAGATVLMPRAGIEQQERGVSGMPQWTEGARYWLLSQGADSTLWNLYEGDEYKDDMKCRAMWVNSLESPADLCLAFHTDGLDSGDDSTIVGTLAIYTAHDDDGKTTLRNGRDREKANRNLADWIQTQVTEDLQHIVPHWTRRQLKEANYCESRVPVVPSMILELLSHKNMADMKYGLNPKFRFAASRAVYKGILRYLNGPDASVQPLPVEQLSIGKDGLLKWKAPIDTLEMSARPTYYMVYTQADNGEWDVQQVTNTQVRLENKRGVRYSYYVVAGNEGGLSLPSPIISSYISEKEENPTILVVNGFDEVYGPDWFADSTFAGIVPGSYACEDGFSCAYIGEQWNYRRADTWTNDDNCGWGSCYRDHAGQLTIGNTHDYAVLHGRALQQMGLSYVSCTSEMARLDSSFAAVDYICGRNRMPVKADYLPLLSEYLKQGGRLLLSTDHLSALDPKWTKRNLHASYYAAQATRSGKVQLRYENAPKRPFTLLLSPNDTQLFTAHPEGLKPEEGSVWATYLDMRVPAAVATPTTLVFGFPLEATTDFYNLYRHSIEWLVQ